MSAHQAQFPIRVMARVLRVSASGLLRVALAARFGPSDKGRRSDPTHPHNPCGVPGNLGGSPRACGAEGRRHGHRP
jgi:hypothetical protein